MNYMITPSPMPQAVSILESNCVTNILALIAAIISFAALIVTVIYNDKSYKQTFSLNNINIEAEYYKKIFDNYIIEYIPKVRKQLSFETDGKLIKETVDQFHMLLSNLIGDVQFFKFRNEIFYNNLCDCIKNLDDCLVRSHNILMNHNDQMKFLKETDNFISELYTQIFESYLGK